MNIEAYYRRWILFILVTPACAMLVGFNVWFWNRLQDRHGQDLMQQCRTFRGNLERVVFSEAVRLTSLKALPGAGALLASMERQRRSALPQQRDKLESLKENWGALDREELAVREILDSSLGETYRALCEHEVALANLFLTDAGGLVVAAAYKPQRYSYNAMDWWGQTHSIAEGRVGSDGIDSRRILGLALATWGPRGSNRYVTGILRSELRLDALLTLLATQKGPSELPLALVASNAWTWAVGGDPALSSMAERASASTNLPLRKSGTLMGYAYYGETLDAGVAWNNPLRVVVFRQAEMLPWQIVAPMGLSVAVSIILALFLPKVARASGRAMFLNRVLHLLEAGEWAIGKLAGSPSETSRPGTDPGTKLAHISTASLPRQLDQWLADLQQDFKEQEASRLYELHRDLDLAKDFQRAYLERPYPRIPAVHVEGHLRLAFAHHYCPALALGGDFFDIVTCAPDCAGIFIADVMGHGTRSALITAVLRTLISDLARQGRNARLFMTEMNRLFFNLLKNLPDPLFVSAFYFVADTTGRVGTFSSAGHPAPFLVRRSSRRVARLEVPPPRGAALGVIAKEEYTAGQCRLMDGDLVLFFTDGVHEAHNAAGEEFGIEGIHGSLSRHMYQDIQAVIAGLVKDINDFIGDEPLADDVCLVAMDVTTKVEPIGSS